MSEQDSQEENALEIEVEESEVVQELPEAEEVEQTESEPEQGEQTEEPEAEAESDEVIVTIGDEEPEPEKAEAAPEWVKDLRKKHRETQKENRRLKEQLEAKEKPKEAILGPKPTLEGSDYDSEDFESKLAAWYETKRKVDEQKASAEAEEKGQREAWQNQLNAYSEAKSTLKVKDFEDAEEVVTEIMNQTQQGIIVEGADNPAVVVYALGKSPEKAKELASIKNPVKFAVAMAKLETQLKVKNRKAPPPAPERKVSGTAPKSGAVDSTLERLRNEAAKTGDMSKVLQYKRQLRAKN